MLITFSNQFKYKLASGGIHLGTDTIKACLVRDSFVFDPDIHSYYKNISAVAGPISLTIFSSDRSINRTSGSFVTDGFCVGNKIVTTFSSNPGPYTVASVSATKITVLEALINTSGTAIVTCMDELETGYGYVRNEKVLSNTTLTEDDSNDWVVMECDDISWEAIGGTLGPTSGLILYSDTSDDDTIIGYIDFGGDQIVENGRRLSITDIKLYITNQSSNYGKMRMAQKSVNLQTDTIKLLLMQSGFTFNQDSHERKSDVADYELPTGNGYVRDSIVLTNKVLIKDNANNWAQMTCNPVSIYALGGPIGPTPGCIIYDDTDPNDVILGYYSFGTERTAQAGDSLILQNIRIRLV